MTKNLKGIIILVLSAVLILQGAYYLASIMPQIASYYRCLEQCPDGNCEAEPYAPPYRCYPPSLEMILAWIVAPLMLGAIAITFALTRYIISPKFAA